VSEASCDAFANVIFGEGGRSFDESWHAGIFEMNLNRERDQRALRREHERERAEAAAETARLLVQQGLTPEGIVEDNAPTEPSHHDISQGDDDDPAAHSGLEEEYEQLERRPATDVGQGAQPGPDEVPDVDQNTGLTTTAVAGEVDKRHPMPSHGDISPIESEGDVIFGRRESDKRQGVAQLCIP